MASALPMSCEICMNTYNEADRKSVSLPCGHDFCLTCLVRLKSTGSHNCPKCRGDWAQLEVQALPEMVLSTEAQQGEEEDLFGEWKKGDEQCRNHKMSYDYWSNKMKEFYCKKCIIEISPMPSELQLIDDAVPMIKLDIGDKVLELNEQLEANLEEIDAFHGNFSEKLKYLSEYRLNVQKLEEKLHHIISNAEALRSKVLRNSALAKKVDDKKEEIKSEVDIARMVSSRVTLELLKQPYCLPALQESESSLCSIACTFIRSQTDDEPPSSAAPRVDFTEEPESSTASTLSLEKVLTDADMLKHEQTWEVDKSNWLAALLALTDRKPNFLNVTVRHDEPVPLPAAAVAALAKTAAHCDVQLQLFNSFYRPKTKTTDQETLEHFMNNSSLRLSSFRGYLNAAGIAKLPTTVQSLGLAIGSAKDARAVSGLKPWDELKWLCVSVSSTIDACDLSRLPSFEWIEVIFPGLTDARVDSVRPAIEALLPDLQLWSLLFPVSQLTAAGACCLAQKLRGASVDDVTFEISGPWRPTKGEKKMIRKMFRSAVECKHVCFRIDEF